MPTIHKCLWNCYFQTFMDAIIQQQWLNRFLVIFYYGANWNGEDLPDLIKAISFGGALNPFLALAQTFTKSLQHIHDLAGICHNLNHLLVFASELTNGHGCSSVLLRCAGPRYGVVYFQWQYALSTIICDWSSQFGCVHIARDRSLTHRQTGAYDVHVAVSFQLSAPVLPSSGAYFWPS